MLSVSLKTMSAQGKTILIADDDSAIVDAISMMLQLYNYEVQTSTDGNVVPKVENVHPDLLLLDIWMTGVDGREVCRTLKERDDTKDIPVIMISASRDVAGSSRYAGADDYLAKPFEMDELLEKVEHNLAQHS